MKYALSLKKYKIPVLTFSVIFIAFFSSFYSAPLWDDYFFIFDNHQIVKNTNPFVFFNPLSEDHRAWPFGYTVFWFLYKAFGTKWVLYKFLNMLLHFINTMLLFKFFNRKFKDFVFVPVLIFALHPLQVETVSWIFQFNTMLATTGILLTIDHWYNFNTTKCKRDYFLALIFFFLSLFTKSYGILIPFFLFFTSSFKPLKRSYLILPFIILSALAGYSTLRGIASSPLEGRKQIEHQIETFEPPSLVKSLSDEIDYSRINMEISKPDPIKVVSKKVNNINIALEILVNRYTVISFNFYYYLVSFLGLNSRYLFAPEHDYSDLLKSILALASFSIFLGLTLISVLLKRRPTGKIEESLLLLLCIFVPISGISYIPFMKYSPVSDHWCYMLMIPMVTIFFYFYRFICQKLNHTRLFKDLRFLFIIPIVLFTLQTFKYGSIFNDHELLFLRNINAAPHNIFLYRYLSRYYSEDGLEERARNIIKQGLMLHPNDIGLIIDWQQLNKEKQ